MCCTPPIAPGIDENASAAIHLMKFLREAFRIPLDQKSPDPMRKPLDFSDICLAVERDSDVKTFRTGSL
jgi:hypothetical protein